MKIYVVSIESTYGDIIVKAFKDKYKALEKVSELDKGTEMNGGSGEEYGRYFSVRLDEVELE